MYADWPKAYENRLPGSFKKLCKNIFLMNMENSNNGIYPLSTVLFFSQPQLYVTLQVLRGDLVRLLCSFDHVNCVFTFHLHYHKTNDTQHKQLQSRCPPFIGC